jgi:uncharacterized protein (TIGR03067 family)
MWKSVPFLILAFTTACAGDPATETFDGQYSAVAVTREGKAETDELVKSVSLVIKGDDMQFTVRDKKFPAKIKTDAKAKPATIDISPSEGADTNRTFFGIWKFEKGELWLAFRERGERPSEFKGEDGAILFRLKRDEKK